MVNSCYIKVRYAETDQMGIVHHSVYPVWFEAARTEYFNGLGKSYGQLENDGIMLPLTSLECKFIAPSHYEEEIELQSSIYMLVGARLGFKYKVIYKGRLLCEGKTEHAITDKSFRPLALKKHNPQLYNKLIELIEE